MAVEYSVDVCRQLHRRFEEANLLRPMRVQRYEPGEELVYDVLGVAPAAAARVRLRVERFVGGGFAGQVYKVRLLQIAPAGEVMAGLTVGGCYAVKILVPPSGRAKWFRDLLYKAGFQGPFSLEVNPAAARAGALWQKLIRRGAKVRFGTERAVADVVATFVDRTIGSCGEIGEWVDGRNWRFEVDDRLDARKRWARGKPVSAEQLSSPEYCAKRTFMREMVELLHEMGVPELARQYEWSTCKSQPNVLKRTDSEGDPAAGLTAVDFRPGLALLPFLPLSPGDFKLIPRGLCRGSLVQFDRGNVARLQRYVDRHRGEFADLRDALEELKTQERAYRDSLVDVTHHHVRLPYSRRLWGSIVDGAVTSWRTRNIADETTTSRLRRSKLLALLFMALGLLPFGGICSGLALVAVALATWSGSPRLIAAGAGLFVMVPPLGRALRRLWGRSDYRGHYWRLATRFGYLCRALRGRVLEKLIVWLRAGRIGDRRALRLAAHPWRAMLHLPLSILPARLHRLLTDRRFAWEALKYVFARPVRLYFNAAAREQWLRDMLAAGRKTGMVTQEEADRIESRIDEPFIQKYLKSLAVHVCTLPVTQIVSVAVAIWYKVASNLAWAEAWDEMLLILGAFQITPISPGSLVRGLYVVYLAVRERNFKDYNIAVFLGFFKYVGYLAFPIQMAYRYPALARFMAAHWATGAVHVVPVFGEHGALMEHAVFDVFYNRPLTVRRRMRLRAEIRATQAPRTWHVLPLAVAASGVLALVDLLWIARWGAAPSLGDIWLLAGGLPVLLGALVTLWAGGARLAKRFKQAALSGAALAVLSVAWSVLFAAAARAGGSLVSWSAVQGFGAALVWRAFLFTVLAALGAMLTEVSLPEPTGRPGPRA